MGQKIHILWINDNPNFKGGAENYIFGCVKELNQRDIKSSVLYDIQPWTSPDWTKEFSEAYPLVDIEKQLEALKPDIIYLHNWPGGKILSKILGCKIPLVRFIHDSEIFISKEFKLATFGLKTSYHPEDYKFYFPILRSAQIIKNWLNYRLSMLNVGNLNHKQTLNCDKLICGSRYIKNHLIEHGVDNKKISIIPPFTGRPYLSGSQKSQNQILFVGQLVRGKGLDLLLHALSRITSSKPRLTVCGEGKQKEELQKLTTYLKLDNQVDFRGLVSKNELTKFYQKSECLVIPSRVPETFCMTGIEGMAHKIPIVTTSLGGMTEWQTEKNCLTFKENNVQELTIALEKILSDKALAEQLSNNAYEDYLKKFQPDLHVEKLLETFNYLIEERKVNHA